MNATMNPEWVKRRLAMEGIPEPVTVLADRLDAFATEMIDPMVCRDPAYGAPGIAHCAGTGLVITCQDEQGIADLASAMHGVARGLRSSQEAPKA